MRNHRLWQKGFRLNGGFYNRASMNLMMFLVFHLAVSGCYSIKTRAFEDSPTVYADQLGSSRQNRRPSIVFVDDHKFLFTPKGSSSKKGFWKLRSCVPLWKGQADDVNATILYRDLAMVDVNALNSSFHYYSMAALGEANFNINLVDTDKFTKLRRVLVKTKARFIKVGEYPAMDYGYALNKLEATLQRHVDEANGDAIMDVCVYLMNYRDRVAETDLTSITYEVAVDSLALTATIVRFKNNFYPEKEYLLNLIGEQ